MVAVLCYQEERQDCEEMPARRSGKQSGSHSIDLGDENGYSASAASTKSQLISNGNSYEMQGNDERDHLLNGEAVKTSNELSSSDIKAIVLLVVLCEYHFTSYHSMLANAG